MSSALVNRFSSGLIKRNNKEITRKQGQECSVTAIASEFIIEYQSDEGICANTHQATGKIPAKTTAGDIAKGNYYMVRKSGVQTVCNACKKNRELRDQMSVTTMSSSFTFPGIGTVRSYRKRWSASIVTMIQQVNMELSWKPVPAPAQISFTEDNDGNTCCQHPSNRTRCQIQSTIHLTCKSKFGSTRMKLISKLHLGTDFLMIIGLYSQHILLKVLRNLCLMETLC